MRRRTLLGLGAAAPVLMHAARAAVEQPVPNSGNVPPSYRLTFATRFDDPAAPLLRADGGPFTSRYEEWGGLRTLPGNREQELYVDPGFVPAGAIDAMGRADAPSGDPRPRLGVNPFSVHDGVLDITAMPTPPAQRALVGLPYLSGMLSTEWSFAQRFGYFEMRASLPAGRGLWPAFWMVAKTSNEHIELDVMEALGHDTAHIYQSVHINAERGRGLHQKIAMPHGDTSDMHSYGLEWTEQFLAFSIDGETTLRTDAAALRDSPPMYMIANLAVGGSWGGNPDNFTRFPAAMRIAHIRAYARA